MSNKLKQLLLTIGAATLLCKPCVGQAALQDKLNELMQSPALRQNQSALLVARAKDGKELAAINPQLKLTPASVTKLITASSALSILGPNYRFETNFYADNPPQNGNIQNLYVQGNGDPFLVSEQLWRMIRSITHQGVNAIKGDIVIDNSFFASTNYPGRLNKARQAYAAKTSAVAVNFNSIAFVVKPGKRNKPAKIIVEPPNEYIEVINKTRTGRKYSLKIKSVLQNGKETFTITGKIPTYLKKKTIYRNVQNPASYAGAVIKTLLTQNGISIAGEIREGPVPARAFLLSQEPSKPLTLIIRDMNKFSNNFIAEQTLKHLGAIKKGLPGTTTKGLAVINQHLTDIGIAANELFLQNGSGLSLQTKLSAEQIMKVLLYSYKNFSTQAELIASLPILGIDGTMKKWPQNNGLHGLLRAKTGTLASCSALAGYIPMQNGELAAFVILTNDFKRNIDEVRKTQLKLVESIATSY